MSPRAAGSGLGRRGRSRRVGTAKLVAVAVAIAAICMITMSAKAVIARASCSNAPVLVNVAVSYDIAPAIEDIARSFNNQNVTAAGRCIEVQVTEGDSATEASQIDGQASLGGAAPVDAWVPDSTLWVDVARTYPVGAQVVQPTGKSVARSPLLLVTTAAVAARTHVFDSPPTWSVLLPPAAGGPPASLGLAVDLPDPTDSSSGLATLIEVSRELGDSAAARTAFTQFVFNAESTENFDSVSGLQQFVASTKAPFDRQAVTVASEQAVLAYDKTAPGAPLVARYPTGASSALGSPELDYPYVLTTSKAAPLRAAAKFGQYLQTGYARGVIRYAGFRDPAGVPDAMPALAGLSSQPLQLASAPSASEADSSLQVWEKLGLGSRDLTLIDVSPAMNAPDGNGTQTLEDELTQTAARGLALFPDSTHMGLWEIGRSRSVSKPYNQLVSIGALPADYGVITRRAQLQQIIATLNTGDGRLALNDAILAAYQNMTATYAPNYANAVLVLTSGVDSAHGDMQLSSLLTRLRALYDPSKKVEIVILMIGRQGNFTAMQEIANATGGVAYQISDPAEVGKIFIEAIAHRMCDQGCAAP
ncbi:MAG TPA: substrate-binding domain-containing protein [Streptosporangiaceae bacterium]|nr:substrate-binding domain-containing protein [Streptosporangiaceae bacterium]